MPPCPCRRRFSEFLGDLAHGGLGNVSGRVMKLQFLGVQDALEVLRFFLSMLAITFNIYESKLNCCKLWCLLAGGFKYFLFPPLPGEDSHFDSYFSNGLKQATSLGWTRSSFHHRMLQKKISEKTNHTKATPPAPFGLPNGLVVEVKKGLQPEHFLGQFPLEAFNWNMYLKMMVPECEMVLYFLRAFSQWFFKMAVGFRDPKFFPHPPNSVISIRSIRVSI